MGAMTRAELQVRLRDALLGELNRLDLPNDGRHLARVARALVHVASELLMSSLPPALAYHVVLRAAGKAIKGAVSMPTVGPFGPLPPGSA